MCSSNGEHGPPFVVVTFIPSYRADVGEVWELGLGRRQAESLTRDVNWASCKANSLVRVGISWGDSRHKSNSLLHAILKSSWVVHVVPVIIVDVHKCINKTHDRNPMLLASMKHLSDEIIQYMVFTRVESGFPP